jgi:release factor glutamine methyltransferase
LTTAATAIDQTAASSEASVGQAWRSAQTQLLAAAALEGVLDASEAKFEAQLLLQTTVGVNRAWLVAHENDALPTAVATAYQRLLQRRLNGEPIAYILGCREFYGLNLMVSPDTLIPRADTETLVDAALAKIAVNHPASILDLGTGSGAIALAIAQQRPLSDIIALDASVAALDIAQQNAQALAISNVSFVASDWFDQLAAQRFDLIVSNPPYIAQHDAHLGLGDLRFEPLSALASGIDGLDAIRHIIEHSLIYLKPQAWLLLEHGYDQAAQVAELMAETGLVNISTLKDLGGNDRVTIAKNPLIVSTHWD